MRLNVRQPCTRCPLYQLPVLHPLADLAVRFWHMTNGDRAQRAIAVAEPTIVTETELPLFRDFVNEVSAFWSRFKAPKDGDDAPDEDEVD